MFYYHFTFKFGSIRSNIIFCLNKNEENLKYVSDLVWFSNNILFSKLTKRFSTVTTYYSLWWGHKLQIILKTGRKIMAEQQVSAWVMQMEERE